MAIPYPKQANGSARARLSSPARPVLRVLPGGAGSPSTDGYSAALRRFHDVSARSHLKAGQLTPNVFVAPSVSYGMPLQKPPPVFHIPDTKSGTSYLLLGSEATQNFARGLAAVQAYALVEGIVNTVSAYPGYAGIGPTPGHGFWRRTHGPHFYGGVWTEGPGGSPQAYRPNESYTWLDGSITMQSIDYRGHGNFTPEPSWYEMGIWYGRADMARYAQHSAWVRVGTAAEATVLPSGVSKAAAASLFQASPWTPTPAWVDPLATPIGGAAFAPATPYALIPKIIPNPFRAAAYQTVRGYAEPGFYLAPGYGIGVAPGWGLNPGIAPGLAPGVAPGAAVNPAPGGGWGWATNPTLPGYPPTGYRAPILPARPAPPGKSVFETKYMPTRKGGMAAVLTAVGLVTETLDVVNAAWKALPKENRTGYYELHYRDPETGEIKTYMKFRYKASVNDKIADLVKGAALMDPQQFLSNMVDEAIEDRIYGGISQLVQKSRQASFRNVSKEANEDRAKQGRQYRKYVPRRKDEGYHDYGPYGRGYETGRGYAPEGAPLPGGPRW